MSVKIAFINQRKETGKTTLVKEIGKGLSKKGKKTLMIDSSPTAELTSRLMIGYNPFKEYDNFSGLYEALSGKEFSMHEIEHELYLLAGHSNLYSFESSQCGEPLSYKLMKKFFLDNEKSHNPSKRKDSSDFSKKLHPTNRTKDFDFILLDTPSSLDSVLLINSLMAADYFAVPIDTLKNTISDMNELLRLIYRTKKYLNPDLKVLGYIINNFDYEYEGSGESLGELLEFFGSNVFFTIILKSETEETVLRSYNGHSEYIEYEKQMENLIYELIARLEKK